MSAAPTVRQRQALYAIERLRKQLGRAPSIAELGAACGLVEPYGIRKVLVKLEGAGLVTVPKMLVTGELALTAAGKRWL